jgi:hypothetical protein
MDSVEIITDDKVFTVSAKEYLQMHAICRDLPVLGRVYVPFSGNVFKMAFNFAPIDVNQLPIWQESVRFCFTYAPNWRGRCPLARECGRVCREMMIDAPLEQIYSMLGSNPYGISVVACSLAKLWRNCGHFRARLRASFNFFVPPTPAMHMLVQLCEGILDGFHGTLEYYRDMEYTRISDFWG